MPLDQLRNLTGQLTVAQRLWIVGGTLGAVVLLVAVVAFAGQPSYEPAFTRLTPANAGVVAEALRKDAIPFQIADAGSTILVPSARLADAKVAAETAGVSADSVSGNELLDDLGFGASEFQQQSAAQRALSGELTRAIIGLDGVASAKVLITPSEAGLFADQDRPASASVVVGMQGGKPASPTLVAAIVSTVSGAVSGLDPADVTVVDTGGTVLAGGAGLTSAGSDLVRQRVERDAAAKVTALLDRAIGAGTSAVSVSADMDFDRVEREITTYAPVNEASYTPVSVNTTTETVGNAGAAGAGGIPGSGSNVPGLPTYPVTLPQASPAVDEPEGEEAESASAYQKTTQTVNYELSQTVDRVSREPGIVKRLSVAVLVDAGATTSIPAEQLSALVAAAVGADEARGDVVTVNAVDFATAAEPAAGGAVGGDMVAMILDYGRSAAGILVALVLLLIVWRNLRGLRRRAEDASLAALPAGNLALAGALPAGALAAGGSISGLGRADGGVAVFDGQGRAMLESQLRQVADERPDALAAMLNGWMASEPRS
jgi:flagellar M-ring protein FliF